MARSRLRSSTRCATSCSRRRAGLRVHRLPPLKAGLEARVLAAPEALAAEVLALVGPGAGQRRRAALGADAALRRRA